MLLVPLLGAVSAGSRLGPVAGLLTLPLAGMCLARIPWWHALHTFRPFLWLILITFGLHLFFAEGRIWVEVPWVGWSITDVGVRQGTLFAGRLLVVIGTSTLLLLTTTPTDLADGLERLLRPLARWRIPVSELSLMLTIALRFIPTIFEEAYRIQRAQVARGATLQQGLFRRLHAVVSILIPVYVAVFRRATELGIALEARGYPGVVPRTCYRELVFQRTDALAAAVVVAACGAAVWWG